MKQHFQQIDVLKSLAIIAVLLLHSLPKKDLISSYAILHIWQAVPVFMVIMGLNLGLATAGKTPQLNDLYNRTYFQKKGSRIFVPFLLVFLLSLLIGWAWLILYKEDVFTFNSYTWFGLLPISGKGNYFLTLLLQSVFVLPIIGFSFARRPALTLVLLILLEVGFILCIKHFGLFSQNKYLYDAAFPRYFSAIAFGLALAVPIKNGFAFSTRFILFILAAAAAIFMFQLQETKVALDFIRPEWRMQHVGTFGYAAFLIALAVWLLPSTSNNVILVFFAALGKASYHIFLVQVLYFGLVEKYGDLFYNLFICLASGYLFFQVEKPFVLLLSTLFKKNKVDSTNHKL